jgi:hypothetical protein
MFVPWPDFTPGSNSRDSIEGQRRGTLAPRADTITRSRNLTIILLRVTIQAFTIYEVPGNYDIFLTKLTKFIGSDLAKPVTHVL